MLRAEDSTFSRTGRFGHAHNLKKRASAQTLLTILAVALLLLLAGRQVHRLTTAPVWIAHSAIDAGTVLGSEHLSQKRLPTRQAAGKLGPDVDLHGKQIYRSKAPGEPLTPDDFHRPPSQAKKTHLSSEIPEGRVLMMVKVSPSSIPRNQLRRGDRLDLITTGRGHGPKGGTHLVAQEAYLVATGRSGGHSKASTPHPRLGIDTAAPKRQKKGVGGGTFLVLALYPEDAFSVAEAMNQDAPLAVVLHGIHEHREGTFFDLRPRPTQSAELISGADRETITFEDRG